jgi:DNA-binding PucR family transcriptional regulator
MPTQPLPWVQHWVAEFVLVESQPSQVDSWVERTAQRVMEEVPELISRPALTHEIAEAIREHWLGFLGQLAQPQMAFRLVPSAERIARDSAQTSLPLETLNRIYRVAQQSTWNYTTELIAAVDDSRSERTDLLIFLWERASEWIDRSINETSRLYHESRRRIDIGRNALWLETVSRVLEGEVLDGRWVSSELGGYPTRGHHTAFILAAGDQQEAVESLEESCRQLVAQLGLRTPLVVRPGGRQLWVWASTSHPLPFDTDFSFSDGPVRSLRVTVGTSKRGLSGFASSHHQARRTLNVVHPAKSGVFLYAEHEALVLLGCNADVDDFVRRTLRGLSPALDHETRLRKTVGTYLALGGSIDRTAAELMVHRNTVRYRLQQATALLGRDLTPTSSDVAIALGHLELSHDGQLPM